MIDLNRLDNLHQDTIPGPWSSQLNIDNCFDIVQGQDQSFIVIDMSEPNAAWIIALHESWPEVSRELKRLRALETVWPQALDQAYERAAQICDATPYTSFAADRIRALKEDR